MDLEDRQPVQITLNRTAAELLARLCVELGTDDAGGVVVRALGLLQMARSVQHGGGRLVFVNARGESSDVAI